MIGIYGGSFDPPHLGHIGVIEYFWKYCPDSSKLLLVPNHISPFKKEKGVDGKNILAMLQILIGEKSISNTVIEELEINKKEISYTIETIDYIQRKYPNEDLFFIIGVDNLKKFSLWRDYKKILEMTHLLVFDRGIENKNDLPDELREFSTRFLFVDNPKIDASSSEIRSLPQDKWKMFLTPNVLKYIEQEELYGFRKTN